MALLDVSEVLIDPMLATEISVVRRSSVVNDFGEEEVTEQTFPAVGVITSTANPMERGPDAQVQPDTITVRTPFPLVGPAEGVQADVIVWKGRRWVVFKPADYTHFGAGFVSADCEALDLVGAAP